MAGIHHSAIVQDGAVLGADVEIGPFCLVGPHVRLHEGVKLDSHVVVTGETEIGARTHVHAHAVLGGGPQFRGDPGLSAKLVMGADNIIR